MSNQNEPFDAVAFTLRLDAKIAERRKGFGRKPGGDTNYAVAVARFMVGGNNPKHEPYLTQIESLVNAYDEMLAERDQARATLAQEKQRADELESRFCPQCDRTNWESRVGDGCDICKLPE